MSPVRGSSPLTADRLASRPPTHSSCLPSRPFVAPAGCCLSHCLCCWHVVAPAPTPSSHWCRHRYCASIFANRRHRHCRRPLPPSNAAVNRRSHPPPPQSNYISLSPSPPRIPLPNCRRRTLPRCHRHRTSPPPPPPLPSPAAVPPGRHRRHHHHHHHHCCRTHCCPLP